MRSTRRPGRNGPAGRCRSRARPPTTPAGRSTRSPNCSGPGCCCSAGRYTRRSVTLRLHAVCRVRGRHAATEGPTALGGDGGDLGFGGLSGVAVGLDTQKGTGDPAGNFIGISTGLKSPGQLGFQSFAQGIAPPRDGTHTVGIKVVRSNRTDVLVVTLDGEQVLQSAEPLLNKWGTARLAFTAGTGALTDVHIVRDVAISTAS